MSLHIKHFARIAVMAAMAIAFQSQAMFAGNNLVLRKGADNTISVELSNKDGIAGAQFSISARGGLVLRSFEASERLTAAGIAVYQALNTDSTLNIVLLAPVRSSLPSGEGLIGKISYVCVAGSTADSVRVFLQKVVICDAAAQLLDVTTVQVSWSLDQRTVASKSSIVLAQNYPNPFNPSTTIAYRLEKDAHVRLAVYDIAGRMVNLLVDENEQSGHYVVRWNAESGRSGQLASGMYFARLNVGGEVAVMKMILTK